MYFIRKVIERVADIHVEVCVVQVVYFVIIRMFLFVILARSNIMNAIRKLT